MGLKSKFKKATKSVTKSVTAPVTKSVKKGLSSVAEQVEKPIKYVNKTVSDAVQRGADNVNDAVNRATDFGGRVIGDKEWKVGSVNFNPVHSAGGKNDFFTPWSSRTKDAYKDFFGKGGWKSAREWVNPGGVVGNPAQQLADPGNFFTRKDWDSLTEEGKISDRTLASGAVAGLVAGGALAAGAAGAGGAGAGGGSAAAGGAANMATGAGMAAGGSAVGGSTAAAGGGGLLASLGGVGGAIKAGAGLASLGATGYGLYQGNKAQKELESQANTPVEYMGLANQLREQLYGQGGASPGGTGVAGSLLPAGPGYGGDGGFLGQYGGGGGDGGGGGGFLSQFYGGGGGTWNPYGYGFGFAPPQAQYPQPPQVPKYPQLPPPQVPKYPQLPPPQSDAVQIPGFDPSKVDTVMTQVPPGRFAELRQAQQPWVPEPGRNQGLGLPEKNSSRFGDTTYLGSRYSGLRDLGSQREEAQERMRLASGNPVARRQKPESKPKKTDMAGRGRKSKPRPSWRRRTLGRRTK